MIYYFLVIILMMNLNRIYDKNKRFNVGSVVERFYKNSLQKTKDETTNAGWGKV